MWPTWLRWGTDNPVVFWRHHSGLVLCKTDLAKTTVIGGDQYPVVGGGVIHYRQLIAEVNFHHHTTDYTTLQWLARSQACRRTVKDVSAKWPIFVCQNHGRQSVRDGEDGDTSPQKFGLVRMPVTLFPPMTERQFRIFLSVYISNRLLMPHKL